MNVLIQYWPNEDMTDLMSFTIPVYDRHLFFQLDIQTDILSNNGMQSFELSLPKISGRPKYFTNIAILVIPITLASHAPS